MNNFLKTAFVAAGVVGTVGAVSTANAASLNVVVDKIELYADNSDISTGVTVYDPVNSIGESATRTIDLFNSTQKKGTALKLATPPAGTYETILLHISSVEVSGATVASDVKANLGVGLISGSELLLPLGIVTNGGQLDLAHGGSLDGTELPVAPFTVSGRGFTLPKLNIAMDDNLVDDNATTTAELLGTFPSLSTVATTSADNADLTNLDVVVDWATAFDPVSTTASYKAGTTRLKVGLFDTKLSERPLQVTSIKSSASASTGTVSFVDVVQTNVVPVMWIDATPNSKLDAGEYFSVATDLPATISGGDINLNIAGISPVGGVGSTISGTEIAALGTDGLLDGVAGKFGPRTQSIVLGMPTADVTATQSNGEWAPYASIAAAVSSTATTSVDSDDASTSATIIIEYPVASGVNRSISLPAAVGADTGGADEIIVQGESFYVGLATSATAANIPGLTWTAHQDAGSLTIAGIPLTIDTLDDGENTGTYSANISVYLEDADDALVQNLFGTISADGSLNVTSPAAEAVTSTVDL